MAIRQIINSAVVSEEVVDVFDAVGLDKPNIGLLDDEFLAQVKNLPEKNLAVELLERLLEGEIKSRFGSNVVQEKKFSDLLGNVIKRYQNRSIETATQQATSSLWGVGGERWTPTGRLADFSSAGYGAGELPIPAYPNRVNVRTYGARGDNTTGARGAAAAAAACC